MNFDELVDLAVPFEFPFKGSVTKGEVYLHRPNKEWWDALKKDGTLTDEEAKQLDDRAKLEELASDPAKAAIADKLFNLQIVGQLKSWDVTLKGAEVPVTLDGLTQVFTLIPTFGLALYMHLQKVRNEDPTNGTPSSLGSPEKEKTESVPDGIESDGNSDALASTGTVQSSNS